MRPCFISGLYCSGWLKTGPTGVIATTMNNSFDTAKSLMDDMDSGTVDLSASKAGFQSITGLLQKRGTHSVSHGFQSLHWNLMLCLLKWQAAGFPVGFQGFDCEAKLLYVEITCFVSTGVKPVLFSDWEKIDSVETSKGEAIGKPREKILTVQEMLQVVHQ